MKSLLILLFTFLVSTLLGFGLIRLIPGDPVLLLIGDHGVSPEVLAELRQSYGLNEPLYEQYFIFVKKLLHFDFGTSVYTKQPVLTEFLERFPATLELSLVTLFWALCLGVPLGMFSALKKGSFLDLFLMSFSLIGYSMPIFWWGLMLILFFSVYLGLTPVSGRISELYDLVPYSNMLLIDAFFQPEEKLEIFKDALNHIILPSIAMGTIPLAVISRMTRSAFLDILNQDYMRVLKSKGFSNFYIIAVHGLRNALAPIITTTGLLFGSFITGAILTENIFSWPGIGKWLVASITARDYPVVQSSIVIICMMIAVVNLLVDLANKSVDPRQRTHKKDF